MLMRSLLARARRRPPGFILPAKPVLSAIVPTGPNWIHELKHDGYRLLCRQERDRVQLWSRNGRDWTAELVAIAAAVRALPGDFVIDGEAVAHCEAWVPDFHRLRRPGERLPLRLRPPAPRARGSAPARARQPPRCAQEARPQGRPGADHMDGADGEAMFRHACRLGLEGIISKRLDKPYVSGRCTNWVKVKNPSYERR